MQRMKGKGKEENVLLVATSLVVVVVGAAKRS